MQLDHCDVVTSKADVVHDPCEPIALKTRLKELPMGGCNGLASLEVGSIHDNVISIFREGGSEGLPIPLVPPILHLLKEIVQSFLISAFVVGVVHHAPFSLSVSVF